MTTKPQRVSATREGNSSDARPGSTSERATSLLNTALELFAADGFTSTGIEKILERSGVAKMTLYNHFGSKQELIVSALQKRDEEFFAWFREKVEAVTGAEERLLRLFDVRREIIADRNFSGCLFMRAVAEFPLADDRVHQVAAAAKIRMYDYIRTLCRDAGAQNPEQLAQQLLLLIEGATAQAHATGWKETALLARSAAEVLIQEALRPAATAKEVRPIAFARKRRR